MREGGFQEDGLPELVLLLLSTHLHVIPSISPLEMLTSYATLITP